jgi:hypothetical protein
LLAAIGAEADKVAAASNGDGSAAVEQLARAYALATGPAVPVTGKLSVAVSNDLPALVAFG